MDLLLLLYSLSFVPINAGVYTQAVGTTRDAIMISTGARHQFDDVKNNLSKFAKAQDVSKPLAVAGWFYKGAKEKAWQAKTKWGTITAGNDRIVYGLSISF